MIKKYFTISTVCLTLFTCRDISVVGEDFIEGTDYELLLNNDIALSFTTVRFDSLITSQQSELLIGGQEMTEFGDLVAESYLLFDLTSYTFDQESSETDQADDLQYDSITITIPLNQSSLYLDEEIVREAIIVEQLQAELAYPEDQNELYNYSEIPGVTDVPGVIVGQRAFIWASDRVRDLPIRLSDSLGRDLLSRLQNNDDIFSDPEEAREYLRGFKVYLENPLFFSGFGRDSIKLTLHTTDVSTSTLSNVEIDFSAGFEPYFIKFRHSNIPSVLEVEELDDEIPSDSLENRAFIIGGLGYAAKIELTQVRDLLLDGEDFILAEANLKIRWLEQQHESYPETLNATFIDEDYLSLGGDQTFTLDQVYDDEYGRDNYYELDLTPIVDFIIDEPIGGEYFLLITSNDFNVFPVPVLLGDKTLASEISIYTIKNE